MLGFLVVDPAAFAVDDEAFAALPGDVGPVLAAAEAALGAAADWSAATIEQVLRHTLVDGLGLKPKSAFTPVRVAVTGRRVSPPLFESMEILGRDRCLSCLEQALRLLAGEVRV